MAIRFPSRYENLDQAFRGRLKPIPELIEFVQKAQRGMAINGGLRFLPIFGESGSGKSSAARELGTHLPGTKTVELPREAIESFQALKNFMLDLQRFNTNRQLLIVVIDQYEEAVAANTDLPRQFVEWLSLLDRDDIFSATPWLFIWLTTSKKFQETLENATSRNRRILLSSAFELCGPDKSDWASIIEETFEFHNDSRSLADFGVVRPEVDLCILRSNTIGSAIESVSEKLGEHLPALQDLSIYQVVMLWPVTDGQRINTILRFVDPREGYRLDWNAWYRQLNEQDRQQLPLAEFNRARLYFDMRLVPIAAADLHQLCRDLNEDSPAFHKTYLERFRLTHYVSILQGTWDPARYAPLRERPSKRASEARDWYTTVTTEPTKIGKRIANVLAAIGIESEHEKEFTSSNGTVRADVSSKRHNSPQSVIITELKAYSPDNTMPSTIRDAVRTTLRRHAQFAGFLSRQ